MRKTICLFLTSLLITTIFSGCSNSSGVQLESSEEIIIEEIIIKDNTTVSKDNENIMSSNISDENNNQSSIPTSSDEADNIPTDCVHQYNEKIEQKAELFKAGTKRYTCIKCSDSYTCTYPIEKIKILSIGNSYSLNSMWELYSICEQAGVKEIDIAIMYIAGCSLDKHWENVQNNTAAYELYRNNSGEWATTKNYSIETIITEQDWDVITLQNSSGMSGRNDGYNNLENMTNYVSSKCPNAALLWHMTWGYQKGSKWLTPQNYNGDEMLMYNSIVKCVNDIIVPSKRFDFVVPVGTAIMNARTSHLKNNVHQDDGSHLSEDIGYYIGAFTWFGKLTGMSIYDVSPASLNPTARQNIDVIYESVENALENPYKITQSYYTN